MWLDNAELAVKEGREGRVGCVGRNSAFQVLFWSEAQDTLIVVCRDEADDGWWHELPIAGGSRVGRDLHLYTATSLTAYLAAQRAVAQVPWNHDSIVTDLTKQFGCGEK